MTYLITRELSLGEDTIEAIRQAGISKEWAETSEQFSITTAEYRDIALAAAGTNYSSESEALAQSQEGDRFTYWEGDSIVFAKKEGGVVVEIDSTWILANKIGLDNGLDLQSWIDNNNTRSVLELDPTIDNTGNTDCLAKLDALVTQAEAQNFNLYFPAGTYLLSGVLKVPGPVAIIGQGTYFTVFKAANPFPANYTDGSFTFPAPVIYFKGTAGGRHYLTGGFRVNGDTQAKVGFLVSGGSGNEYANIRVDSTTESGYDLDGVQNSLFRKILTYQTGDYGYRGINGTYNSTFIACDTRQVRKSSLHSKNAANYPQFGVFTDTAGFEHCTFVGGIDEEGYVSETRERVIYLEEGRYNIFLGRQFYGSSATIACVETGANAAGNTFIECQLVGGTSNCPAIIARGYLTRFSGGEIQLFGPSSGTTIVDLIEVYNFSCFDRIRFLPNNYYTGKLIANKSASPNDTRYISYTPFTPAGSTALRPVEDVDANYEYFDSDLKRPIWWDFINNIWRDTNGLTAVGRYLEGSKTHNFGVIAANGVETTTVTVTGAALGDYVIAISLGVDLQGIELMGYVSSANTVTVNARNFSASPSVDLASSTLRVLVKEAT